MSLARRIFVLASINLLLPIACLIFASGFFPYKPFLPGLAQYEPHIHGDPPAAPFDRVIFMVVDALRSDFVYAPASGFTFTQRLISQGSAWPFTAHATAPTVTMPRVKAITTGSIPSFVDMILNVAESDTTSNLANQDTWLAQMKAKNGTGKLVMYGDDTWLKLFPSTFERADGTVSFFVSDFTEVDANVTRHLPTELQNDDWNTMIMHYLGMDHIGHKAGPRSVNMRPKQGEMDNVVKQIYQALETTSHLQNTLLVLCGDHGMNEAGNHGGSAPGETSPALVFIAPQLGRFHRNYTCPTNAHKDFDYYDKVEQSDIAPTLAGLLGFPIPMNNLGVFIPQFLDFWQEDHSKVYILRHNALQMLRIVKATFPHPWYEDHSIRLDCTAPQSSKESIACAWNKAENLYTSFDASLQDQSDALLLELNNFCKQSQELLSSTASNYNMSRLLIGIALSLSTVFASLFSFGLVRRHIPSVSTVWLLIAATTYTLLMFASSYVEEEQQFWYWISAGWLTALMFTARSSQISSLVLCLSLVRISRRWNQSGQKYAGSDDIVAFLRATSSWSLWPLVMATFLEIGFEMISWSFNSPLAWMAPAALVSGSIIFKLAFTLHEEPELLNFNFLTALSTDFSSSYDLGGGVASSIPLEPTTNLWRDRLRKSFDLESLALLARTIFVGIGAALIICGTRGVSMQRKESEKEPTILVKQVKNIQEERRATERANRCWRVYAFFQRVLPIITLFLVLQTRVTNIPLFLLFNRIRYLLLEKSRLSTRALALTSLFLAQSSFFSLGGTNAISSIDLSNAYNGVLTYNPVPVGILLFVGNWAGPIYWALGGIKAVLEHELDTQERVSKSKDKQQSDSALLVYFETVSFFMSTAVCSVMLACTALRTHLFVWTVFSPKFLYTAAWLCGWHLFIGGGLVIVLTVLGAYTS